MSAAIDALAVELVAAIGPKLLAVLKESGAINRNELMTTKEVARELRISDDTVRRLVHSGAIKRAPDLTEIRIRRSEMEAYGTTRK